MINVCGTLKSSLSSIKQRKFHLNSKDYWNVTVIATVNVVLQFLCFIVI